MEPPVPVVVVRAVKPRAEPRRLCIRHEGESARGRGLDALCLATDGADLETRVLWAQEDFVAVETEEDVGRVLAGWMWCSGRASVGMGSTYRRRVRTERWHLRDGGLQTE